MSKYNTMTIEEFVERSSKVHDNKFDYSKVEYKNANTAVVISCPVHGDFFQKPGKHLLGDGCFKCYHESRVLKTSHFIDKCIEKHGTKFDYSKVDFRGYKHKVVIGCERHGYFSQYPQHHLRAVDGCPMCGRLRASEKLRQTGKKPPLAKPIPQEEFIIKAKQANGDRYDYSHISYKNSQTNVVVICKTHLKEISVTPTKLSAGYECPHCREDRRRVKRGLTFIESAKKIHGDRYDYSRVKYVNAITEVEIICRLHGIFTQTPATHLRECGCKLCRSTKGENIIANFLACKGIGYDREACMVGCVNPLTNRPLRYDFFVPTHNLLIEFDGKQHSEPFNFGRDKSKETKIKNLKEVQYRDKIKNDYAAKNNIKLIRIPYTEINNIEEILGKEFGFTD